MRKEILEEFNPWWFSGKVPEELAFPYRRTVFGSLMKGMGERLALGLTGLRRIGKSTLLFQLIESLLEQGVKPASILYFSFDERVENLDETIGAYRESQNADLRGGRCYIFLDEVQKLGAWSEQVKKYYDLYPKVKFIVSGSESLFVRKGIGERLGGRMKEFFIPTLSFREFLDLKGQAGALPAVKSRALFSEFLQKGGFPEMANEQNLAKVRAYVRSAVIERIAYGDIAASSGIRNPGVLLSILEIIAGEPGMLLEYNSLAQQLGADRRAVQHYVSLLASSFLVRVLANYRGSSIARLRKAKRAYVADNAIALAFRSSLDEQFMGRLCENAVANATGAKFFWRNAHEVDFVVDGGPVEVKYQSRIVPKDALGLRAFMRKFRKKRATIITKNYEGEMGVAEGKIYAVPADEYLLEKARHVDIDAMFGSIKGLDIEGFRKDHEKER